jgi:adenine-specific DNA-methyltransferase
MDEVLLPRLRAVINGSDAAGVSALGGGFRYHRLAPSLLDKDRWGKWVISQIYNPTMLAEAVCKLMGFTYAPSDRYYWMHGYSSEHDFIYVTTQSLTAAQLRVISEEVGEKRSLLICCKAFRANADGLENLFVKKIPQAVLDKCEWGKDDYSLRVAHLAPAAEEDGPVAAPTITTPPKKKPLHHPDLFAAAGK